jgi:DNA-binding transcriptional LysR family regulator
MMVQMPAHLPLSSTLPNLESFARTYETGSFTSAARVLSVTPQAVSRSVGRLEHTLGVTLFRRTTRTCAPTDAAHHYYQLCKQALSLLATGERELASRKEAPQGQVRISVGTTFGHHRFLPWLGRFRERAPEVDVEVQVSNHDIDFVEDGYDMAIRMGSVRDASLVARKLGDYTLGVFASPSYVARFGAPKTPEELERHTCIGFVMPSSGRILPWVLAPEPKSFVPDARYRCSDDPLGLIAMARAGVGLVQIYDFLVEDDVTRGSLVEVLGGFRGASRPFSLLYQRAVVPSRPARALIDFIVGEARRERYASP